MQTDPIENIPAKARTSHDAVIQLEALVFWIDK
jgi:hypothetical protein